MKRLALCLSVMLAAGSVQAICFSVEEKAQAPALLPEAKATSYTELHKEFAPIPEAAAKPYLYDLALCSEMSDRLRDDVPKFQVSKKIALLSDADSKMVGFFKSRINTRNSSTSTVLAVKDYCVSVNIYNW